MVALTLDMFLATAIGSLVLGSLYALVAMGFSLIYSTVRILNFAHGGFYLWGVLLVWWFSAPAEPSASYSYVSSSGLFFLPLSLAIIIGVGILFVVGVGVQRGIVGPLLNTRRWEINAMAALFALAVILQSSASLTLGPSVKSVSPIAEGFLTFGNLRMSFAELTQFGTAIGVLIALQVFLKKTRHGLAMRAVAQDREAATVCSVRVRSIYLLVFGMGAALAALAGILLSNLIFVAPTVGWFALYRSLIIIILGGIGSVPGTLIAAFMLAFIEQYSNLLLGYQWALSVVFAAMILVLILRPQGLFGLKE